MLPTNRLLGRFLRTLMAVVGLLILNVDGRCAFAQMPGCTPAEATSGPPRQILRCAGFTLEVERGASWRLLPRNGNGQPEGAVLDNGGILVDYASKASRRRFQILTPQAVASVRGTSWVVDVAGPRTSVFVISGRVEVSRRGSADMVTLMGGDGVDVEGAAPLTRKRWAPARAAALLARFGR